jgi:hypothetical protein
MAQASLAHERWSQITEDYHSLVGATPTEFVQSDGRKRETLRELRAKRRSTRGEDGAPRLLALPET